MSGSLFEDVNLPEGKIIMPGVLGHCAPEFVEHPQLVAQRLLRYADLVGRENVIAGTHSAQPRRPLIDHVGEVSRGR